MKCCMTCRTLIKCFMVTKQINFEKKNDWFKENCSSHTETLRLHPIAATLNRVALNDYAVSGTDQVIEKGTSIKIPGIVLIASNKIKNSKIKICYSKQCAPFSVMQITSRNQTTSIPTDSKRNRSRIDMRWRHFHLETDQEGVSAYVWAWCKWKWVWSSCWQISSFWSAQKP